MKKKEKYEEFTGQKNFSMATEFQLSSIVLYCIVFKYLYSAPQQS